MWTKRKGQCMRLCNAHACMFAPQGSEAQVWEQGEKETQKQEKGNEQEE